MHISRVTFLDHSHTRQDRPAVLVEAALPPGLRPGRPAAARPGARPLLTAPSADNLQPSSGVW